MTTTALDETSSLAALSNTISFLSQLYYTKPGFLFPLSSTSTRPQDLNINAFFLLMCMCFGPWDCPLQSSKERIKVVDHHWTVLPNVNWRTERKVQSIDQGKTKWLETKNERKYAQILRQWSRTYCTPYKKGYYCPSEIQLSVDLKK